MAARETDGGDGIPWGKPLKLVNILNAPAVEKTNKWIEVGIELGIEKYVLNKIAIDYRTVDDCKREMFCIWLDNNSQKTWNDVNCALKRARKRLDGASAHEREESRVHIKAGERKALNAISQLKESLETMDDMNMKLVGNQRKYTKDLKAQKTSLELYQSRWRREDMEWNGGEQRRKQTKQALEGGNLRGSQFVKDFLREKQLPNNLSDQEVECYLRKDILEEELTRSRQMRSQHYHAQKHREDIEYLLGEANKWKELVEERLQVYDKILRSLEELGMQPKNLKDLQRQLTELKTTLNECERALEECHRTLREGEDCLRDSEVKLREFTESFGKVVKGMEKVCKGLEIKVEEMEQYVARPILGVSGAVLGTIVLPVIGTAVGGALGWGAGKVIDLAAGNRDRERAYRLEMETKQRTLRNCNATKMSAKHEYEELMKILHS